MDFVVDFVMDFVDSEDFVGIVGLEIIKAFSFMILVLVLFFEAKLELIIKERFFS